MNLFIDANVFLRFYGYSEDRLEELNKLILLIEKKELKLFVTKQLVAEIKRNREIEIKHAYKDFSDIRLDKGFPYICRTHEDFKKLYGALNEFYEIKDAILKKLEVDIREKKLKADLSIDLLLSKADLLDSDKYFEQGKKRMDVGNPPGKNGSLGDAINWQTLLVEIPAGEDLFFISKDSDFQSPLGEGVFNGYLQDEWIKEKESRLYFYNTLTEWAKNHQKDIMLKLEDEKNALIDRLLQSGSFAETHLVVQNLVRYDDFSSGQIDQLLSAGLFNSQVRWILSDEDVRVFYNKILEFDNHDCNQELLSLFKQKFNN